MQALLIPRDGNSAQPGLIDCGTGFVFHIAQAFDRDDGTLVIDAYDSKEKKMVWRGSGTVTVKDKPEKQVKQVEKIVTKLGKRWDKILAGMDK